MSALTMKSGGPVPGVDKFIRPLTPEEGGTGDTGTATSTTSASSDVSATKDVETRTQPDPQTVTGGGVAGDDPFSLLRRRGRTRSVSQSILG